jgi:hypothetical protein
MSQLRVNLSSGGRTEFLALLTESGIDFTERTPPLGAILASIGSIEIIGAIGAPLAAVVIKWLHRLSSRSVTIQTSKNAFVELKGYSPDEIAKLLKDAVSMNAIQRTKDDT